VLQVSRLFARNERLICHFETDFGKMIVILVGALLVSGVETGWDASPVRGRRIHRRDWRDANIHLQRCAEMAWFNYGSTVIVLLPPGVAQLEAGLAANTPVRVGQALGWLKAGATPPHAKIAPCDPPTSPPARLPRRC